MKFLLEIICEPENLEQKIKNEMQKVYGIILQLEYVGALPLSDGKVLIAYEFEQEGNDCKGNLFVIKRKVIDGIGEYWVYSTLSAKICEYCKATLEEYMSYCPYCGNKGIWKIC